ncbi:hypothetical protein PR202_ga25340 [Eleusine coracana subsp. coracana]|uniref:DNA-directed primase/polymerase protein n=1 Tax=Eleusine coracana subsp. coracana TaxID=191504 RepID=A0AAV5DB58_ELECO|nr:hypothetical protein PR202_ga25340 [Eleusine coracana subsp. coracana]
MARYDPKEDVDRLFACFKCGASPPRRKQMAPMVFYGSPQGVPVKKPLSLLRLLREIHIDLKKQTKLIPRDVWATFPRQEEAIRYNDMDPKIRHHYEVIQEDKYSIEGHEEWITELDSSTEAQRGDNSNLDKLYIKKDSSSSGLVDQLFMDTAVYSRNRCFRLAFSSKSGKRSFLLPTGRFRSKEMNDKDIFMKSLICRLDDDCEKLLICKLDLECKKTLHFDSEVSMQQIQERNFKYPVLTYRSDFPHECTYGKSPFPALDNFIESIASFGNVSGFHSSS